MPGSASPIQHGILVLADISGYTSFLSQTELDHAQEILSDLLEVILRNFKPLLAIHKIEGDAVFAHAPASRFSRGETLLELIEATYAAFRDRLKNVRRHTTCTCRACQSAPTLDLKFLVHCGDFVVQDIGGVTELAGSDVNLVHRLLKNHVSEGTGWRAYAAFTLPALAQMGLDLPAATRLSESYDHLGEVVFDCIDLHARYDMMLRNRRVYLSPPDADRVMEFDFRSPPAALWEWFNDAALRSQWMGVQILPVLRVGGRLAAGARNHCVHGNNAVIVEDVLDFKPFDYFSTEQRPRGNPVFVRTTFQFVPTPAGGTHLLLTCRSFARGIPRFLTRLITRYMVERSIRSDWAVDRLDDLIEAAGEPRPSME
jgi:uncharacterized protein YndB with AHSA1/START domain